MYKYIQKTLDWGVKIASLAVTGPATWVVATDLFSDIESPELLFVMRFAAVFLIEGVLLSNWLLLEFDKNATPEIKARYGITALAMYIALLVIGYRHEGPTGLVFRIALLAALIGSGWDTYVYTWQKATSRVDRSAENSGRVRRHARRLAIDEAIMRRRAEHDITVAELDAQKLALLEGARLGGERQLMGVQITDEKERLRLMGERERYLLESEASSLRVYDMDEQRGQAAARLPIPPTPPVRLQATPAAQIRPTAQPDLETQRQTLTPPTLSAAPGGAVPTASPTAPAKAEAVEARPPRPLDMRRIPALLDAIEDDPTKITLPSLAKKLNRPREEISQDLDALADRGHVLYSGRKYRLNKGVDEIRQALGITVSSGNGYGHR